MKSLKIKEVALKRISKSEKKNGQLSKNEVLSVDDYLKMSLNAQIYDLAQETPLQFAKALSEKVNNKVLLKREDLQTVRSFKIRGAYNKILNLGKEQLEKGVICASSGNHAQGVALSASHLSVRAVVVMPTTTPEVKVSAVRGLGADVVLHGQSYTDAYEHALILGRKMGLSFVHPFDDPYVIAGQGTIGLEILRQSIDTIDAMFIAIGGGGLIAGIASVVKALRPEIKIIGVQMNDSDAMFQAVQAKERVTLDDVGLFSDGTAVKCVGEETFRLVNSGLVDDFVIVDTDEVCAAIKDIYIDTRTIVEPSGAQVVAAIKQYANKHKCKKQTFTGVVCGANMNFDRLRFIAERAEVGEEKEALFAVTFPEERGSFRQFCKLIETLPKGPRSVTEFNYRISDEEEAHFFVGISTTQKGEGAKIAQIFNKNGFKSIDLTHDDLARDHIRHLAGGRSHMAENERLLRFTFPERPGALMKFLSLMKPSWNVSLFHYRNQGADYARILVGVQVPPQDAKAFDHFLKKLGYPCIEETDNPVYQLFLR